MIDDPTLEHTIRDSLHDAADHAALGEATLLADAPVRVAGWRSDRRHRHLLAAAAIVVGVALVVTVVATRDGGGGHVRVAAPAGDSSRVLSPDALPRDRADLEVFMTVRATDDEVAAVRAALETSPDVAKYAFLDHDAAYAEFATVHCTNPDVVRSIRAQDLPESFRVLTTKPDMTSSLATQLRALPGVIDVAVNDHSASSVVQCFTAPGTGITAAPPTAPVTTPTLPPAGVQPDDPMAARDAVVAAFRQAWDGSSTVERRRAAMQDSGQLAAALDQARTANSASVAQMTAVIGDVSFVAPTRAAVVFHLEFGTIVWPDQLGYAVLDGGMWRVSRETVCDVLANAGVICPAG